MRRGPLGERCLRPAGHREDYGPEADREHARRPKSGEPEHPVPSARRVSEDRRRIHGGIVPVGGAANPEVCRIVSGALSGGDWLGAS